MGKQFHSSDSDSEGEDIIYQVLTDLNFQATKQFGQNPTKQFIQQFESAGLVSPKGNPLRIDFYIANKGFLEIDGLQHYIRGTQLSQTQKNAAPLESLEYLNEFQSAQICDQIKDNFAHSKGIPLLRVINTAHDFVHMTNKVLNYVTDLLDAQSPEALNTLEENTFRHNKTNVIKVYSIWHQYPQYDAGPNPIPADYENEYVGKHSAEYFAANAGLNKSNNYSDNDYNDNQISRNYDDETDTLNTKNNPSDTSSKASYWDQEIKFSNDFEFSHFQSVMKLNIFMQIILHLEHRKETQVDLDFSSDELEQYSSEVGNFVALMKSEGQSIFTKISYVNNILHCEVSNDFKNHYLNPSKAFYYFDLRNYLKLNSIYAKSLYLLLVSIAFPKKSEIFQIEELEKKMQFDNTTQDKNFTEDALKPAIAELNQHHLVTNLQCVPLENGQIKLSFEDIKQAY